MPGRATYREVLPRPELAASVACFWTLSAEPGAGEASRVLPDGSMDLLFDLTGLDAPSVVGAMTEALISTPRGDRVDLLGVRFQPGEASAFLGRSGGGARAMRDELILLRDLWGPLACVLTERLAALRTTDDRILALEQHLMTLPRAPSDLRVRRVVRAIRAAPGGARVAQLAASVGMGERQLERLFDERVGVGPKALASIFRVHTLLAGARVGPRSDWARLATELGWSDQAHLTRDLRRLAGITPSELARALRATTSDPPTAMSDSFNPSPGPLPILAP